MQLNTWVSRNKILVFLLSYWGSPQKYAPPWLRLHPLERRNSAFLQLWNPLLVNYRSTGLGEVGEARRNRPGLVSVGTGNSASMGWTEMLKDLPMGIYITVRLRITL